MQTIPTSPETLGVELHLNVSDKRWRDLARSNVDGDQTVRDARTRRWNLLVDDRRVELLPSARNHRNGQNTIVLREEHPQRRAPMKADYRRNHAIAR
jgi:hypothetical protein